jgi:H+/Cl- antiporter ClcA
MKEKSDFTAKTRLLWISLVAMSIGLLCAVVALVLQRLIFLFTNLFYYQQFSLQRQSPAAGALALGLVGILVPVAGGLVIGLMARYGSERIRGHGIPEALEAILIGRSRMSPKVAVLKPLSSAISIGSGGPFGAEGPIIMTGGACGSIVAQTMHLTAAERKTLLVAGAAGGMTATFGTPVAAVLLAVELLLFEWKPRSLIPVALACAAAMLLRPFLPLDAAPLFPIAPHGAVTLPVMMMGAAAVGLFAGLFAFVLTNAVYLMEDLFHWLPCHWMWWPALGGLAVGIGGYFQPRALGVGYDIIDDLLNGRLAVVVVVTLMLVKSLIWAIALGSGTSGGVLAPLLIMGGALGALAAGALPAGDPSLWALVGMAGIMGGTMRSPFTGVVFALELTLDVRALPALLVGSMVAYAFTVLVMKRSILTEKVARRGYHVSREYSVDPLERASLGEVMTTEVRTIPASMPVVEVIRLYFHPNTAHRHQGYPVVDEAGRVLGVLTRANLLENWVAQGLGGVTTTDLAAMHVIIAYDLIQRPPIIAYAWESCRTAAERMAEAGVGRLVVVSADDTQCILGIVTRSDLLKPRARELEEEEQRERFLGVPATPGNPAVS